MQEMEETRIQSLGRGDPLEEGTATHSSILAWRISTDRGVWWTTVHSVAKSQTQLKQFSTQGNAKECSNYHRIALISHPSKVILKILQARLQQYVNQELQMFKLDLEKAEEPEINC